MKVLMHKLKAASKPMKFFYFLFLICYIVGYFFFCKSILQFVGIETAIRISILVFFGLYGFCYLLFGLTSLLRRKKKAFIPLSIFAFLFSAIFFASSYYMNRFYNAIDHFTQSENSTYTTVLLTLNDTEFDSNSKLAMINNKTNRENYILAKEMIETHHIQNEVNDTEYDDIYLLAAALYSKEVDGIFISKDYAVLLGNEEKFQNILAETKVVDTYSKEMKTEESEMVTTKSLTEPFTILILGVDSENQERLDPNAAFNGDTLLLVTFNPKTLNATMFSIPRDLYVPISCNGNRYNKVNAAAYGGTSCVVDTIETLTDIDIDYFVKVDFKAVVDLVDAMGGIDVYVEPPDYDYYNSVYHGQLCEQNSLRQFGEHLICMDTGDQHLNGEQALAYARNRHGYLESDIARNKHQQLVLEAMAKKLVKTASFSDFETILDSISKHIATNMKTTQILSFYQAIKNMLGAALSGQDFITIQKTYLTYYNIEINTGGYEASALGYYEGSLDAITDAMKENLGLLEIEPIKTFAYDYSTDYERTSEVIGKGIYTGSKLAFMPDFVGDSISSARSFASMNDLDLGIEYVSDPDEAEGIILRQSVSAGTMVKNISGFTIYVNDPEEPDTSNDPDIDTNPEEENEETETTSPDEEEEEKKPSSKPNNTDKNEDKETIPGNPTVPNTSDKKEEDDSKKDTETENKNTTSKPNSSTNNE